RVAGKRGAHEARTAGGRGGRIINRDQLARGIARVRKIARQFLRNRQCGNKGVALDKPHRLGAYEEKCLVLAVIDLRKPNRSAEGAPKLVELERWWRGAATVGKEIVGVQLVVAKELVEVAVEVVAAGAGDDIENAARCAPVFGGVVTRFHLEFLYQVGRGV